MQDIDFGFFDESAAYRHQGALARLLENSASYAQLHELLNAFSSPGRPLLSDVRQMMRHDFTGTANILFIVDIASAAE